MYYRVRRAALKYLTKSVSNIAHRISNAANFVTMATDALGRMTAYQYDAQGNNTQVTKLYGTPSVVSWNYTYEPVYQQLQTSTDPLGHITTLSYDAQGNVTRLQDPLGNSMDMTYDGSGRRLTVTRYDGSTPLTTTFGYDGSDLVSVRDPLNRLTELFPDAVGRIVNTKDPLGRFTHLAYDDLNRVIQTTDAQGQSESWGYDGNGNRIAFTDAKNQVTAFSYDPRNRLKSKQDALLKTETYDYDLGGNPIFITDRRGLVTGHVYDALDRRIQTGFGATSTLTPSYTSTIAYTYDAANRLIAAQDSANGIITRSYDDRFDTVAQEVSPQGTVDYTYSADGQRQSLTPSGGSTLTYAYDGAHRLTEIMQAAGLGGAVPTTAQTVGLTHDTANRPIGVSLPNGITLTYGYDAASQLSAITYKKADGTTIGDLTYTYNAVGNRIATGGSLARTGLPSAIATTQYDVNNRLLGRDGAALSYDDNGNLTNDGTRTYTWNERNQLASISGTDTASYSYDAFGRRSTAAINGQTTSTLYDGWNPIQLQAGGVAVENRLTGLGLDANFARTRSGVTESYLSDALGSTLELRNAAQNQTVEYTYDPYGNTASSVASTNGIKYTGREQDLEDLYYYRNRYYKPSAGRFISEDPIGLAGGSNVYAYVLNSPLKYIDPLGFDTTVIITRDYGIGSHAAVHTDRGSYGEPSLYDPAGSYLDGQRGSGDLLSGDQANLQAYINYQKSTGSSVETYRFPTTPGQEGDITRNAERQGGASPGFCSVATSGALNGVPPFNNLGLQPLPGDLAGALANTPGVTVGGK